VRVNKRWILGIAGLVALAVLLWLYYAPSDFPWRNFVLELLVVLYGAYIAIAYLAGWSIPLGAHDVKPDEPWFVRFVAALIGVAVVIVGVYLMLS
jgi:hypothetical protein